MIEKTPTREFSTPSGVNMKKPGCGTAHKAHNLSYDHLHFLFCYYSQTNDVTKYFDMSNEQVLQVGAQMPPFKSLLVLCLP